MAFIQAFVALMIFVQSANGSLVCLSQPYHVA